MMDKTESQRQVNILRMSAKKTAAPVSMDTYGHVCTECGKRTMFLYGPDNQCRACYEHWFGPQELISEMERGIIEREDEIADLQTIILLAEDMNKRIKTRLAIVNETNDITG